MLQRTWLNYVGQIHSEGPLSRYVNIGSELDVDNSRHPRAGDGEKPRFITSIKASLSRCTAKSTPTTRGISCGPLNKSVSIEVGDK